MKVLVSDSSVLIDLERGSLLEATFSLSDEFAVPDLLYEQELKSYGGDRLVALGLRIEELAGELVAQALGYRRIKPILSVPDSFALALAKANGWTLLAGDKGLRELAAAEAVQCHGVLWLLDRLLDEDAAGAAALHAGLTAIAAHPRCRLPRPEIKIRLDRYAALCKK